MQQSSSQPVTFYGLSERNVPLWHKIDLYGTFCGVSGSLSFSFSKVAGLFLCGYASTQSSNFCTSCLESTTGLHKRYYQFLLTVQMIMSSKDRLYVSSTCQ